MHFLRPLVLASSSESAGLCPLSRRRGVLSQDRPEANPIDPSIELTRIGDYFDKEEKDFPKHLMQVKARSVRETIRLIEASTEHPELVRLKLN